MLRHLISVLEIHNVNRVNKRCYRYLAIFVVGAFLVGCQSAPKQSGRYTQHQDSAPKYVAKTPETLDAVPKYEAYRMFNSRPYKVLGKHYTPMQNGKGYEEVGFASWYGQKFHGHLTSNGETYNMFAMIHERSKDAVMQVAQKISSATGIKQYDILFTEKEFKKNSMKYFVNEIPMETEKYNV